MSCFQKFRVWKTLKAPAKLQLHLDPAFHFQNAFLRSYTAEIWCYLDNDCSCRAYLLSGLGSYCFHAFPDRRVSIFLKARNPVPIWGTHTSPHFCLRSSTYLEQKLTQGKHQLQLQMILALCVCAQNRETHRHLHVYVNRGFGGLHFLNIRLIWYISSTKNLTWKTRTVSKKKSFTFIFALTVW